jgi:hypothetical protein
LRRSLLTPYWELYLSKYSSKEVEGNEVGVGEGVAVGVGVFVGMGVAVGRGVGVVVGEGVRVGVGEINSAIIFFVVNDRSRKNSSPTINKTLAKIANLHFVSIPEIVSPYLTIIFITPSMGDKYVSRTSRREATFWRVSTRIPTTEKI